MTDPVSDWEVIRAMERYGGSFVRTLAQLCERADEENLAKIKGAWPNYWQEYTDIAIGHRRRASELAR